MAGDDFQRVLAQVKARDNLYLQLSDMLRQMTEQGRKLNLDELQSMIEATMALVIHLYERDRNRLV